ncbi:hypothetical protein COW36_01315 [bacterium (Candidatus Blackallbacteria) CG17_big_fil_post_rev_8_21_14_2_50_48_46]|uniref:Fe2OG dioxygenase domain-containing protein n=1 Tax=bacterium (Candidatus Blackallbacteria) CG17_big_fil_post_rev_8_21_14_2_50_48_46 TaxID=2014261 RepID=A0A2M7GBE7_9BACT|nr:MAG: hypothetical protein COW64_09860 [bacterium (Candidatus Blackallbacteria) CG18_big_fil_WC_8_21_14_2_50_49_26]PIW19506.1 MAG: hypothetical protein COW36_01315 [bacterium (Candidatus Blackallbacteria) CG17_big_fil_post_rev_8_21_14_2_50_48_46]PIW48890.1 MAG: hypothetical protein COW20_07140 [bacterium (Candidatus Blackallbacteria) CG13_big_fil_rev_8_21_14_2_50_49_14]
MELESNENLLRVRFIPQVFTPEECRKISALEGHSGPSLISGFGLAEQRIRNSESTVVPPDETTQWIADRLISKLHEINNQYYHFRLSMLSPVQIITYNENGFYDWHIDMGGDQDLSSRKLSVVTFLSDPSEYQGGALKIIGGTNAHAVPSQEQGTTVFFPSYLLHKVEPVRRGKRQTLVMWAHGPCFS